MFQKYKDINGDSNVVGYEILTDGIIIEFGGHQRYHYNYSSAGMISIEIMKRLAQQGDGLNSFVKRTNPPYVWKKRTG